MKAKLVKKGQKEEPPKVVKVKKEPHTWEEVDREARRLRNKWTIEKEEKKSWKDLWK